MELLIHKDNQKNKLEEIGYLYNLENINNNKNIENNNNNNNKNIENNNNNDKKVIKYI